MLFIYYPIMKSFIISQNLCGEDLFISVVTMKRHSSATGKTL